MPCLIRLCGTLNKSYQVVKYLNCNFMRLLQLFIQLIFGTGIEHIHLDGDGLNYSA